MNVIDPIGIFLRSASIKIESVKEAKKLYGSQIAPDFLIFDYLRDDEMGLSRCIGNLLDPNGKHAQGATYLNLFIAYIHQAISEQTKNDIAEGIISSKKIDLQFDWRKIDSQKCNVKLELSTDAFRRIDIHLHFNSGHVIGIENKPWAGDQPNQLSDYADFLKRQSIDKEWLLIYLSNSDPDEQSISIKEREYLESQGRLLIINYDDLTNWLQNCLNNTKAPIVRVFIEELSKFIKKEVNREADMEVTNQLISVVKDNFDVAMQVSNTIEIVKRQLIATLKGALLIECELQGKKLQWKPSLDNKWIIYTGFGINFSKDQPYDFEVWFEFVQPNLKGLYWGIRRKDASVVNDKSLWNEINQVMSEKFGPGKLSPWWPWWAYYDFEEGFKNWETSPKPWAAVQDGSFVEQVLKISNEVNHHFINIQKQTLLTNRHLDQ